MLRTPVVETPTPIVDEVEQHGWLAQPHAGDTNPPCGERRPCIGLAPRY
jgi:hypothetical protein